MTVTQWMNRKNPRSEPATGPALQDPGRLSAEVHTHTPRAPPASHVWCSCIRVKSIARNYHVHLRKRSKMHSMVKPVLWVEKGTHSLKGRGVDMCAVGLEEGAEGQREI